MSVSGIDGAEPGRVGGVSGTPGAVTPGAAATPSLPAQPVRPAPPARGSGSATQRQPQQQGLPFGSPDLQSGLLSDSMNGWQRESLGRLSRMLRMNPREVLSALRYGMRLPMLLAARRMGMEDLYGMFDKGLLIDALA